MRILHTSDWHIGRTLHKVSMREAQRDALRQICEIAAAEDVGLIVVSGDVFDHAVPSADALEVLEDALSAMLQISPVVITAGNHDSLRRLGYGSRLFTERLHIRTRVDSAGEAIAFGPVRVYPIPYLHPETARVELAADGADLEATHEAVMSEVMDRVRADLAAHPGAASMVMAHAWVAGGATSDSERDVSVGGLGTIPPAVFAGVDYVALGHLHGPQEPRGVGSTRLRYSGSPLRYSFSESGHEKSVTIVDLEADGTTRVRAVPIAQPRSMAVVRGLMDELLDPDLHADSIDAWVRAVVTDDRRPSQMWPRLQERFPRLLQVSHEPEGGLAADRPAPVAREQKPSEVAADFVEYVTNGPIAAAEGAAFDRAVQLVRGREQA
ncbi:MAG: exonuclease SbcCD subunit D [Actinobacteria bacterium]|nr:MAG: exonuclease SbcCD subunit D [Actinomycetota bacterium]